MTNYAAKGKPQLLLASRLLKEDQFKALDLIAEALVDPSFGVTPHDVSDVVGLLGRTRVAVLNGKIRTLQARRKAPA